jgi:hypothetical protein
MADYDEIERGQRILFYSTKNIDKTKQRRERRDCFYKHTRQATGQGNYRSSLFTRALAIVKTTVSPVVETSPQTP